MEETSDRRQLLGAARDLTDTVHDHFDQLEHLTVLTELAVEVLGAQDAGVLANEDGGGLGLVTATSHEAWHLKLHQAQRHAGPCIDALDQMSVVTILDMQTEERWPSFTALAVDAGYTGAVAAPIVHRSEGLGVLNVLWSTRAPQPEEADVAQGLADLAGLGWGNAVAHRATEARIDGLREALDAARAIELAKAVLAQELRITPAEAFTRIRRWARDNNLRMVDAAKRVTDRQVPPGTFAG